MAEKTYSENEGEKPFDWNKALSSSVIDSRTWNKLKKLANSWVTCACGNQCAIIPREDWGEPVDDILARLGGIDGFLGAIQNRDKEEALNFLQLIEVRSAYLIKKLSK